MNQVLASGTFPKDRDLDYYNRYHDTRKQLTRATKLLSRARYSLEPNNTLYKEINQLLGETNA